MYLGRATLSEPSAGASASKTFAAAQRACREGGAAKAVGHKGAFDCSYGVVDGHERLKLLCGVKYGSGAVSEPFVAAACGRAASRLQEPQAPALATLNEWHMAEQVLMKGHSNTSHRCIAQRQLCKRTQQPISFVRPKKQSGHFKLACTSFSMSRRRSRRANDFGSSFEPGSTGLDTSAMVSSGRRGVRERGPAA